jgi:tetratricopeptide (TPR) repeat protein
LDSLGRVLKKKGEYEKAKPLYLQALDIVEKIYGPDHIKIALICTDLADVERKLGKSSTAYEL